MTAAALEFVEEQLSSRPISQAHWSEVTCDDADAEAGRAPEEYKDEEQAVSRVPASEQIQFDVMGMMLCNYKDEAGAAGRSTTAETSAEGPPGPPPLQQHF